jgi:enolase-phosphatase E1
MVSANISFILTDIEGTTTSISFVTDELFPYFREHISELITLKDQPIVSGAFAETVRLAKEEDGEVLISDEEIIEKLRQWSIEDRKITPLKTLQGVLWDFGYKNGSLKGHVYSDVAPKLKDWKNQGIQMGVFSSGSIAAQKLIFGYSIAGDLTPYFSAYFDTTTGGKRETATYSKIADQLNIPAGEILFLSDISEELEAAKEADLQTVQLVRPGAVNATWEKQVSSFDELQFGE